MVWYSIKKTIEATMSERIVERDGEEAIEVV